MTPQIVLDFWFGKTEQTEKYFNERNRLWFGGTRKIDAEIREKFEPTVVAAAAGELNDWRTEPLSLLALVVVLDQFSLNIYRDQARSFTQSALAIPLVKEALAKNWHDKLEVAHRVFLYLPLEHSEDLADQTLSVVLFKELARSSPPQIKKSVEGYLDYAVRHFDVVKKFGRMPDRNEIMNRPATAEEVAYMKAGGPPF